MELILALLSLISAATGALTGARAPETAMVQAAQVGTVAAPTVAVAPVAVAAAAVPAAALLRDAQPLVPTVADARGIPLYADRRIE